MADPVQDNLIREIQEDLRREKFENLWKRYGAALIAAAVALVLAVAGYQAWRAWEVSRREARSAAFVAAEALSARDPAAAEAAFAELAADGNDGYAMLAGFQAAGLLARQGRADEAGDAFEQLAAATDHPLYRDLARLRAVQARLAGAKPVADPDRLGDILAPLMDDTNPWRHSARELAAVLALQRGDEARARALFAKLEADAETPQGIRARASEVLPRLDAK